MNKQKIVNNCNQKKNNNNTKIDELINYECGLRYWKSVPASISGVLGGFGEDTVIPKNDITGSSTFLRKMSSRLKVPENMKKLTLDVGAGIGRVTKHLLSKISNECDLLEPSEHFAAKIREELADLKENKIGDIYVVSMQDWEIPKHKVGKYYLIWCQWCLGQLTDVDLVLFLNKCRQLLIPNDFGSLVIKENISHDNDIFDPLDMSVTRTDLKFKKIISESGFKIIGMSDQKNFLKELYPVRMYFLKPA